MARAHLTASRCSDHVGTNCHTRRLLPYPVRDPAKTQKAEAGSFCRLRFPALQRGNRAVRAVRPGLDQGLDGLERTQPAQPCNQEQGGQEVNDQLVVTIEHLHTVPTWTTRRGYCARQSRAFFAENGLDWLAFVREGIPAQRLLDTGNALAILLVEHAQRVESGHGR